MGCDIHFYVEKKDDAGKWQAQGEWRKEYDDQAVDDVPYKERFYNGRNYGLFSILANVRNGYGFAGVDTGDGYKPISEPKGIPDDCSAQIAARSDDWGCDGHSHSFLTVRELLDYDWTQKTMRRGQVDLAEFVKWRLSREFKHEGRGPESYCGSAWSADMVHIEQEAADKLIKAAQEKYGELGYHEKRAKIAEQLVAAFPGKTVMVKASWAEAYYRTASNFLSEPMPKLLALAAGDYDSVRCVFWFDN